MIISESLVATGSDQPRAIGHNCPVAVQLQIISKQFINITARHDINITARHEIMDSTQRYVQ
ncbi:MAG: hypothetical protein RAO92_09720 [Candidatus Euphemobacter frigidus]|nr:hypothetical protein [Candidatus Euphemobacter frigidus]